MESGRDDLQALAFFHYLIASLAAFFALMPVIYLGMALAADIDPLAENLGLATKGLPPRSALALAGLLALLLFACAAGLAVAGRRLVQAQSYGFCQAMACVALLFVPFGTMLGIWSLAVLARAEVRALFGLAPPARST